MAKRLLLFDIDCTLLDTGGAGMASLREAAVKLYGEEGPPLDLAGSTDSGIVMGILEHFMLPYTREAEQQFYETYLQALDYHLDQDTYGGRLLSGVKELLDHLQLLDNVYLGLLTGNIAQGAQRKIIHFGVERYFGFGAYGDDHHDRNKLGPIALERAAAYFGRTFSSKETVIIGDTPKDIACGKALGAKTVCVATGKFTRQQLEEYTPDFVLNDLADPPSDLASLLLQ